MKRDLILLTGLACAALSLLMGLGVWQLQRLEWKQGLIAQIEARTRAEPVSLDAAVARWRETENVEYLRVRVEGRFLHDRELHLFSVVKGQTGWRIVTPLERADGRIVMVVRGFVPDALKAPETRAAGQVEGLQSYVGLARAPGKQGQFTPDNDVRGNVWHWRDIKGMVEVALPGSQVTNVIPFFVELEANQVPGGWPKGGVTRVNLPNKHLHYAITWFGLAGGLLAVFAIYMFGRLRRRTFT